MFWKLTSLSASSPVESVLDKENFSLEELLDEEELIQECKALNSRLINYLRDKSQVEQLLRYIVEDPLEDADNKRAFKFPFISCEIFACEIDVILKTLVEEEELMDLLFSFLEPNRPHSALLAGYFSKVVVLLMVRKTAALMNYVKIHQNVIRQLVDLIGITSIMEVLIRLAGADDHAYTSMDVMQWLVSSDLLDMIVDKLSPSSLPEVHANAAEILCAISQNAPSALATKLSSPSFVGRIFKHALEDSHSKSSLVHSLSVCISLLDPKRYAVPSPFLNSFRSPHIFESSFSVNHETINAMLPKLGELLILLDVSSDKEILPTTYGELRPPLGNHRLKIVEFIAVLSKAGNEATEKELVSSGIIQRVLDLFFKYPYNNALHHLVESLIMSRLESKKPMMIEHLLQECNLVGKILQTDTNHIPSGDNQPTLAAGGKRVPRAGSIGHITRISNKLVQLASSNSRIKACLQESSEWGEWEVNVLHKRNALENVYRWACGRPTALQGPRDSDEDDLHDRDYDVAALANTLNQALRYKMYGNEEAEEDEATLDQDDEGVYFDDESAHIVTSSLKFGDDQGSSSLFTNVNWLTFQDDRFSTTPVGASSTEIMDDINLNGATRSGNGSSDDEVVVGEEEDVLMSTSTSYSLANSFPRNPDVETANTADSPEFFHFDTPDNKDLSEERPAPEWAEWSSTLNPEWTEWNSTLNPFIDQDNSDFNISCQTSATMSGVKSTTLSNGSPNQKSPPVPSLFEEDVEFVGVEIEGTEKAMVQALKEGIVGEAGPLKRNMVPKVTENLNLEDGGSGIKEFNDTNFWRVDQEVAVLE